MILTGHTPVEVKGSLEGIPDELKNSAAKILAFSGIPEERAALLQANLRLFQNLKDKNMMDNEARRIREIVAKVFFEVYEAVLKRVIREKSRDRLPQMLLRFAYLDENLLTPEQVMALYQMTESPAGNVGLSIYDTGAWMEQVYSMEKDPSLNEYGLDYFDVFRDKKKRGELTEQDRVGYERDCDGRLQHELLNLFRLGQRICCGHVGSYFPTLHKGMIQGYLEKSLVTPERVKESLNRVLEVDFSAFHRELVYSQPGGIQKELIMKPVMPDFILVPTFGSRAVMWQGLTGKVRNSPGRILFPQFTSENLDNLMIDAVAKFRWDLSKSMYSYTNNDGPGSLVSDYIDYLQFYRKNRDLSDEAREKVKKQVDKYRNNTGEIFAADYHTWITYESKGLVRLNKVARKILFKHCPFSKTVREGLVNQPLYSEMITRFNTQQNKKAKLLEARYMKQVKPGTPADPELMDNLIYHMM
ncbi:MAG: hypothetical protein HPY50_19005 [Firmicutes bacterium]|nr:hypothetical protein [Bacillota bacterium]